MQPTGLASPDTLPRARSRCACAIKRGDLLDEVTVAGANRIDGIAFIVSNQESLLDAARRKAFAAAEDKADLSTPGLPDATPGKVMNLAEDGGPSPRPMARAAAASAAVPVPVEAVEMTPWGQVVWSLAE